MNKGVAINKTVRAIIAFIIVVLVLRNSLYTEQFPILHYLLSGCRFIGWILFIVLFTHSPKKIDGIGFWLLLYGAVISYSTLIHHSGLPFTIISVSFDLFMIWGLFVLYRSVCRKFILRIIILSMSFCVYLNFLLLFVYPDGIWTTANGSSYYLLGGNYNQMGRTILPAIAITGYYRLYHNKMRINFVTLVICSMLTLLFIGSKTSLVGISLMVLFYLTKSQSLRKWFFVGLLIVYIAFQTMAVFMQQDFSDSGYITYFVEDVLQKDMTFTNRTIVWLKSLLLVQDSPIIGYGYQSPEWYSDQLSVTTAHNLIIGQLLTGGVVGLSLFVCMVISAVRRALHASTPASLFLLFGLCTFFFMMIMEVYPILYIALLLLLLYNTKYFAPVVEQKRRTQEVHSEQLAVAM